MRKRVFILLKVVLSCTLLMFSVVISFAPLSSEDFLEKEREAATATALMHGPANNPLLYGFESLNLDAVKRYAGMYGVDFRLVLAIIKQESQFDEEAVSERGARGFMQIMPYTGSELREELELAGPELPVENIRAGTYYFSKLYSLFPGSSTKDRLCFALAAYNAGPARIYDAQELAAYIGEDAGTWSSVRSILPLLSKRYYSLHQTIWEGGRPPSGCFGDSRQTIDYVRSVLKTYEFYRSVM